MSALASWLLAVVGLVAEPSPAAAPSSVAVPAELLSVTSMPELSGIVWSAALGRYLVISDDTGDKSQGTNHAPWLFTMSRDGVLDGAPIPILGIDKLNDAEALCLGPGGTYFLSTSHSPNRKGHDKPARRRLFQLALVPNGRALQILGALDLAGAIADSGTVPPGPVDIEALAFHGGALYVGLKAPQSPTGAAILLRVRGVESALASGALPPHQIERYAEVPLRAAGPSGEVVQGISDMSFLPDGSLVLLANSPKHMPADGGGALYWLHPGRPPSLLRRFPGLKPEGVAVDADGRSLVIVFDSDRRQPLWLRQPLPSTKSGR